MDWNGREKATPGPASSSLLAGSVLHEPQPRSIRKMELIKSGQMVVTAKTATPGTWPNTDWCVSLVRQTSANMAYSCSATFSVQCNSK